MKTVFMGLLFGFLLCAASPIIADSGVVVESSGDVKIKLPGGSVEPAAIGKKCPDGTVIQTGVTGKAVVVTEFGQMFRIGPNTSVKVGDKSGDTGTVSVSQGLMLAMRESLGGPQGGPRAHGAVKALSGNATGSKMNKQTLDKEIKEVDGLPIESVDAKTIIKSQIYYRYGDYNKVVEMLEPLYQRERKASFVREMLANAYERSGKTEAAAKLK